MRALFVVGFVFLISLYICWLGMNASRAEDESKRAKARVPEDKPPAREVKQISIDPDVFQVIGKDGRVDLETQSKSLAGQAARKLDEIDPLPMPPKAIREWQKGELSKTRPVPKQPVMTPQEALKSIKAKTTQYKQGGSVDSKNDWEKAVEHLDRRIATAFSAPGLWSVSKELNEKNYVKHDRSMRCSICNRMVVESKHATYKTHSGEGVIKVYCQDE